MSLNLTRQQYCEIYGPTLGDQVRLGDTDLFIEVEKTKYPAEILLKPLNSKDYRNI